MQITLPETNEVRTIDGALTLEDLERLNQEFEGRAAEEILQWAYETFHPSLKLACSFGGATGMVLMDIAHKIEPDLKVFYIDTDFLFPETYALKDEVERRYGIRTEGIKSRWTPEGQAREFGEGLWQKDPDLCCQLRKVEPNHRVLENTLAWISGLRRDQSGTRKQTPIVRWDQTFGLVKVNPLALWTEEQVWAYVEEHDIPFNPLLKEGYPSLGCTFCTRQVKPGEDLRAGRWSGFGKTECGLHVIPPKNG